MAPLRRRRMGTFMLSPAGTNELWERSASVAGRSRKYPTGKSRSVKKAPKLGHGKFVNCVRYAIQFDPLSPLVGGAILRIGHTSI